MFLLFVFLVLLNKNGDLSLDNILVVSLMFLASIISYIGGITVSLVLASVLIFVYGSIMIYLYLLKGYNVTIVNYIWMIFTPIILVTCGTLSYIATNIQKKNLNYEDTINNLIALDAETNLGNTKLFYYVLEKEIKKFKRYENKVSVMIIQLPYYKEIYKIVGKEKYNNIIKEIGRTINLTGRYEDELFNLEDGLIAVIMPNTDYEGSVVLKERIKSNLNKLSLDLKQELNSVSIDFKLATLEYSHEFKNALEFKHLVEEELQYDV